MTTKEARRSIQTAINKVKSERVVDGRSRIRGGLRLADLDRRTDQLRRLIQGHQRAIRELEEAVRAVEMMKPSLHRNHE